MCGARDDDPQGPRPDCRHGAAGYLVGLLAVFLLPGVGETLNVWATIPSAIGEIATVLYLLVVGCRAAPRLEPR